VRFSFSFLKLQMRDQRVGLGSGASALVAFGFRRQPRRPLRQNHGVRGGEIGRERFGAVGHVLSESQPAANASLFLQPDAVGRHVS
jgi:hypothetical protein